MRRFAGLVVVAWPVRADLIGTGCRSNSTRKAPDTSQKNGSRGPRPAEVCMLRVMARTWDLVRFSPPPYRQHRGGGSGDW